MLLLQTSPACQQSDNQIGFVIQATYSVKHKMVQNVIIVRYIQHSCYLKKQLVMLPNFSEPDNYGRKRSASLHRGGGRNSVPAGLSILQQKTFSRWLPPLVMRFRYCHLESVHLKGCLLQEGQPCRYAVPAPLSLGWSYPFSASLTIMTSKFFTVRKD